MENYEVLRTIGTGSFGEALLVRNVQEEKQYVMKRIIITGMKDEEKKSSLKEVQVLRMLKHPNVIGYRESFLSPRHLVIIMDFADGGDLHSIIHDSEGEYMLEEDILDLFIQIAQGLSHIHENNILHRDLKTQNIFLTKDNVVKLGDFGISKVLTSHTDVAKTMIGTPFYLSPEMCEDKPYDFKSDIWALGCVLYEMATLRHAFTGQNLPALIMKILKGKYPPIPEQYSSELRELIDSMLQLNPENRPTIQHILSLPFLKSRLSNVQERLESESVQSRVRNYGKQGTFIARQQEQLKQLEEQLRPLNIPESPRRNKQVNDDKQDRIGQAINERRKGRKKMMEGKYPSAQNLSNQPIDFPADPDSKAKHDKIWKEKQETQRKKQELEEKRRRESRERFLKEQEEKRARKREQEKKREEFKKKKKELFEEKKQERIEKEKQRKKTLQNIAKHRRQIKNARSKIKKAENFNESFFQNKIEENESSINSKQDDSIQKHETEEIQEDKKAKKKEREKERKEEKEG
eukprot:gb/GECH01014502.1/.p1 GENE.gb/GECH01014502.1/~~gb/GECH01014502.1/.p1  ORF type:complete len:520 (+),score=163.89 gb/GECH01014502.1/:1-1560(+)